MSYRPARDKVFGILYPGEMGSALGRLMIDKGFKIVATLEERGPRTMQLSEQAGLEILPSLGEVVEVSDVVISLVHPSSALAVAERYCGFAHLGPERQIFIDANSVSPETVGHICSLITDKRKSFIDAAIHGPASMLSNRAVLLISGERCQEVARLFAGTVKVKLLGEVPGRASAYKMIMGGMTKGIAALFLELSAAAEELDLLDDLLVLLRDLYPGLMDLVDRLLPTYPLHAKRRGEEMCELERTLLSLDRQPRVVREVRGITTEIGRLKLAQDPRKGSEAWTAQEVIKAINSRAIFRTDR